MPLCGVAIWAFSVTFGGGMEKTLKVLNQLEGDGVISRYAIGGAMGATFYVEPVLTFDLDIFVILPKATSDLLLLTPIYDVLRSKGYKEEDVCINIEGVPVQFLPAYNALLEEALNDARETNYGETPTRVLRAEHLVAISLQTGRSKDRLRVQTFLQEYSLDMNFLSCVLSKHGLEDRWVMWTT